MNIKRDIANISIVYFITLLYVIFIKETIGVSILIVLLYVITVFIYISNKLKQDEEKETSLGVVLQRLDQTQKENEETYKQFLSLSKTLGSGVFMIDDTGKITFSNKDMENYFGINFNKKDYNEISGIKPLFKFVNEAYLTEKPHNKQITYRNSYYDLTSTPLFEKDIFNGTLILVHDITVLKTAEKFQKRFTADVSHELRTPLSAIKGFSEILNRNETMKEEDKTEFIALIQKEAERMEVILSDLLVISKLDRIDYELELQAANIKNIIEESITVLKTKIKDKDLALKTNLEDCILDVNKVKISQVILNLIKNAISYTDEGFIHIDGKKEKGFYIIQISDSGIGIPKDKQEVIFKRFYRVDKARSRDTGGSGLGLSISKNVILKHGGDISVESKVGKGSTFTIKLPIMNSKLSI